MAPIALSAGPSADQIADEFYSARKRIDAELQKLRDLDVFVLDNSLRESTVGQVRGHTLEDKRRIYNEVKRCGFKNIVVAAYGHNTRVDDVWVRELVKSGADTSGMFAFSDMIGEVKDRVPNTEVIPIGLSKMKEAGLRNVILEMDLSDRTIDFDKFPLQKVHQLIEKRIRWAHKNLCQFAKVLVNIRDLGEVMQKNAHRVFETVSYLARLPECLRPFGLLYEDVSGNMMPEEVGNWATFIRKIMDEHDWKGHLLVHMHEKFGFSDASQLKSLACGADGIWASVCTEGASIGHASSSVTLMNLIRIGNKKVIKQYNCQYLRKAAINVTLFTTGQPPHKKQPIYGERALDFVFGLVEKEFDLAGFFDEEVPLRISTISSPQMLVDHLKRTFGENAQFTLDVATRMLNVMIEDLMSNRKEEYMSASGIAVLFDRAGGKLTEEMSNIIAKVKDVSPHATHLIKQIREVWDDWDQREVDKDDDMLTFDSFYDGFMAPYFGCYKCSDTLKALQAIDMDNDGQVDWNEFLVYLKWALNQNPDMTTIQQVLDYAFRKGIIPAMRDEVLKAEN